MVKQFLNFIKKSPSSYHAVNTIVDSLKENGFNRLFENQIWQIEENSKYYVVRNDSSVIAFTIPNKIKDLSLNIVATHTDSPTLKIKPNFQIELKDEYVTLNTDVYGGPIYSTWLDRPLSVCGKVMIKQGNEIRPYFINIDKNLLVIPNLAIHLDREINTGKKFDAQIDLLPLISNNKDQNTLLSIIAKEIGAEVTDIISHDLSLYVRDRGTILGANNEFIVAPQIDNLECTFASLTSFLDAKNDNKINIFSSFDHEEVGSRTKQGAASPFLKDVVTRIFSKLNKTNEEMLIALDNSLFISADNAHAHHPNHQGKSDPTNRPIMNKGIVIKYNANQSYATDLVSASLFKTLCNKAGVLFQDNTNRSDQRGGSTLGNISSSQMAVTMIDIGLPQLAMHSAMETAGVYDLEAMIKVIKEFYNSNIYKTDDNNYCIE